MQLSRLRQRGLTLLELMVVIAIIAMVSAYAVPGLRTYSANAQVRTSATNLQLVLKEAQAEASRSFRQVVFFRTASTTCSATATAAATGNQWVIAMLPLVSTGTASVFKCGTLNEASSLITVTGPAVLCFSSNGRPTALPASVTGVGKACSVGSGDQIIYGVDTTSTTPNLKKLQVWITLGGSVRTCDSQRLSTAAPDGCPATNQTPTSST